MVRRFKAIIFTVLCLPSLACAAPLVLKFEDVSYMETYHTQRQITIMPLYTDAKNLKLLQNQMPVLSQIPIDQAYYLYEEYYMMYDDTPPENRAILYLIISTKY